MAIRFVDARGTEWEVWEVRGRRTLADAPPPVSARLGLADGSVLRFESATQRRRLARYPQWWQALTPPQLAALCEAAQPERPYSPRDAATRVSNAR